MANKRNNDKILTHECNVISNLLNTMKREKSKNSNHSPKIQGCINTRSGTSKFGLFWILLGSGSSSTIVIGKLTSKIKGKNSSETTTWETQAGKSTTSKKTNIDFCLPEFSATKILSWKFHVDNKNKSRYDMILGRDLLTALGLDLIFSENIIISVEGPYEGCLVPMADFSNYDFKSLTKEYLNRKNPLLIRTLTNASNSRAQ